MAKNNNLTDFVTDIADAIRAKCKTTGTINPQDFSKFVGGMPFFKFRETVDITANANNPAQLPLSFDKTYIKGYIYLENDNGLTSMSGADSAVVGIDDINTDILFEINNTNDRFEINGYWQRLPVNYFSLFIDEAGTGESLINGGWHIKLDIYELCMGNPDGENTKMNLNNAVGGAV